MTYDTQTDGNLAALAAHERAMDAADERAERAIAAYSDMARGQLRDEAINDSDAIADVLATLAPTTMASIARAALKGDQTEIGRILAPVLERYVSERENDESEIERVCMQMERAA